MKIETEDVFLRKLSYDDLPVLSKIYSDEDVMRYIGLGGPVDENVTNNMISAFMRSYENKGFGIWGCVEKSTGELIGHCGFNTLPDGYIEIAYLLDKPYWGRGIATSIAKETLRYGTNKLGLETIVALAYPQNLASIRVIEKIGLIYHGERNYFGRNFSFFCNNNSAIIDDSEG